MVRSDGLTFICRAHRMIKAGSSVAVHHYRDEDGADWIEITVYDPSEYYEDDRLQRLPETPLAPILDAMMELGLLPKGASDD